MLNIHKYIKNSLNNANGKQRILYAVSFIWFVLANLAYFSCINDSQHILDAIDEIHTYLIAADLSIFIANSMMRFACIKQMEIIGEASNHLSAELKSKFSDIEWAQIVGMRNVFAHEYFGIDSSLVWEIIKNDIPELKEKIDHILKSIQ
ncbi:MAG: DUF86 domain-containing protein [Sphingobacteriales bacterium]|nr:DUF86 domain-containing protein [Sphingobacteriales bacterium]